MLTIHNEKYIRYADSKNVSEVVAEIFVDTSDELPAVDGIEGYTLLQGSTALIITENKIAILAGDGKWYIGGEAVE